jgi:hypothetical protein
MKHTIVFILFFFLVYGLFAQEEPDSDTTPEYYELIINEEIIPEAMQHKERFVILKDLRRFEIITLGSFPIVLFYTRLGFDLNRYIKSASSPEGADPSFRPWPFKNINSYKPTDSEQWLYISIAAGVSVLVGVVDYILVKVKYK